MIPNEQEEIEIVQSNNQQKILPGDSQGIHRSAEKGGILRRNDDVLDGLGWKAVFLGCLNSDLRSVMEG
jgi:hypothetical protein